MHLLYVPEGSRWFCGTAAGHHWASQELGRGPLLPACEGNSEEWPHKAQKTQTRPCNKKYEERTVVYYLKWKNRSLPWSGHSQFPAFLCQHISISVSHDWQRSTYVGLTLNKMLTQVVPDSIPQGCGRSRENAIGNAQKRSHQITQMKAYACKCAWG